MTKDFYLRTEKSINQANFETMKPSPKHTEELAMESQDLKKLQRQLIPILLFPFLVAGFFFLVFTFVFNKMGDGMMADGIVKYVMIGFGIFFMAIIGYMVWSYFYDIRKGIKYRITGLVTDKKLSITRTQSGGKNKSTKTTRHYYIFIDDVKYNMDYSGYNKVKVGDQIKMDKAPKSGLTLLLEVLEESTTPETKKEAAADLSYLKTKMEPIPFTETDFERLKNQYKNQVKSKFLWTFPMLFIIFSLVASGMSALLVFLFPIVIIPCFQFYKIIRLTLRYFKNKAESYKQGTTALVDDKVTISSNRSATKYQVDTTAGNLAVPENAYRNLSKNDKIIIFKPIHGKDPLSVVTMDQEEYYLN